MVAKSEWKEIHNREVSATTFWDKVKVNILTNLMNGGKAMKSNSNVKLLLLIPGRSWVLWCRKEPKCCNKYLDASVLGAFPSLRRGSCWVFFSNAPLLTPHLSQLWSPFSSIWYFWAVYGLYRTLSEQSTACIYCEFHCISLYLSDVFSCFSFLNGARLFASGICLSFFIAPCLIQQGVYAKPGSSNSIMFEMVYQYCLAKWNVT